MQLNLISFLHLVAPGERFCMVVTGTLRQSVGFPGAMWDMSLGTGIIHHDILEHFTTLIPNIFIASHVLITKDEGSGPLDFFI